MSGKKFKNCCDGVVDWEAIVRANGDYRPYLSVRGRNLYFTTRICEALQLTSPGSIESLKDYKAAFTADAVRKIHESVMEVWPPDIDTFKVLQRPSGDVSGLYIGDYSAGYITRGIVRHSIYANKILLVDPFIYPRSVRDEFNPVLNPEQYRGQTLKNVNLWFGLVPWIEAGIVEVVRPPSDFDPRLNWKLMEDQVRKIEENPALKKASERSVDELSERHTRKLMFQHLLLCEPDTYVWQRFDELGLGLDGLTVDDFLKSILEESDLDPVFLEPMDPKGDSQIFTITSGASYPSAKMTAEITRSYLFTDIYLKWREIELDRESHSAGEQGLGAVRQGSAGHPATIPKQFAAFDHAFLRSAEKVSLESLRGFLHKVWKDASKGDEFNPENALRLAEELGERIRDAEQEWKKIDSDLLKIVGTTAVAGTLLRRRSADRGRTRLFLSCRGWDCRTRADHQFNTTAPFLSGPLSSGLFHEN